MSAAPRKQTKSTGLPRRYMAALHGYLAKATPANLKPATRLGEQAVAQGLDTLDLVLIHDQSLLEYAVHADSPAARDRLMHRAGVFFTKAIAPVEATHRTALEASTKLKQLNAELSQHTRTLVDSNRKLQKEVAKRKAVEAALRESRQASVLLLAESHLLQKQMRLLSRRVLSAQEDERRRISRELHDVIAQMLSGINLRLVTLKKGAATNTKELRQMISDTQRLVEKSVGRVHRFARELRPSVLDDLGLIPALRSHVQVFSAETGIHTTFTASAGVDVLDSHKRTALYRVAQEALTNIARHARASEASVVVDRQEDVIHVRIQDNGKSFDVAKVLGSRTIRHLGLLGMRERVEMVGGRIKIQSVPGQGTTVTAEVPLIRGKRKGGRK